ncbi:ribonuclease E inhibitor RraB [Paenibacillus harenae]|uniref:ribonuclease E inhibitor RraB n=1 Tax=Paenibacillus harenae TaxID=306543 RepID=UPI00278CAB61|nr:ribonuclease E inhibitor RraB [Paenibacillus harenae]MDQ0059986.1 uncharacterized protein YxeA [Paenibacillus harenae]
MMKYIMIISILAFLIGCSNTNENLIKETESKLIIEQYFYTKNEEDLRLLSEKLREEGYKINDYKSYELRGETEWYFYSSKEIYEDEIDIEDSKSENYAKEYNVGYDGHGFPLE